MRYIYFIILSLIVHLSFLFIGSSGRNAYVKVGVARSVIQVAMKAQNTTSKNISKKGNKPSKTQKSHIKKIAKDTDERKGNSSKNSADTLVKAQSKTSLEPNYPERARVFGIQGKVKVKAIINDMGKVINVEIKKSSGHSILDKEAMRTVRLAKFEPALFKGEPVESETVINFNFELK